MRHQRVYDPYTSDGTVHLNDLPECGIATAYGSAPGAITRGDTALSFLGPHLSPYIARQVARGENWVVCGCRARGDGCVIFVGNQTKLC
jgi:hypothetical protein